MSRRSNSKIKTDVDQELVTHPFAGLDAGAVPPSKPTKESVNAANIESAKPRKPKGRVEVRREKAGRGGKTVTTLRAFPSHIPLAELNSLASDLKKTCACGGALKGRVVELQGDVCERVMVELIERRYQPVRAGG